MTRVNLMMRRPAFGSAHRHGKPGREPNVEPITSTRNPRVRDLAALHRRRERRERGQHLVEGPNAVVAALAAGVVEEVWATEEARAGLELASGTRLVQVADHVLERVADAKTPQGIVALARTPSVPLAEVVGKGLLVVLDAVADPGNIGTIVRTADAAGAVGVVVTEGSADVFAPKTVRAAAGSTYHLPIVTDVAMAEVIDACHAAGQSVFGLDGSGERSLSDLESHQTSVALVLGNEAHGLSETTTAMLDGRVAIALRGRAESLNVAAAAAIAIYAAARGVYEAGPASDGASGAGDSAGGDH